MQPALDSRNIYETPVQHFLYALIDRRSEARLALRAAAAQGSESR